jgi:hypothetical protein
MSLTNIFSDLPSALPDEVVEVLLSKAYKTYTLFQPVVT